MSDSSKRARAKSIAAFLFLPQFGTMFKYDSHLVPLFMRTIATLFVQAGLLPPAHPATLYGARGAEKCSFTRMMGDALFTLRSKKASLYQWSVFSSVVLMVFIMISAPIVAATSLAEPFINKADAQVVWDSPVGGGDTSIDTVPQANTTGSFDRVIPGPTGAGATNGDPHGDYAIAILDKLLRQGAAGKGTPMQNAIGNLIEIFNAGILVIAGLMLFWLIVSVVVDVARTGQVGGGRHNMVWAPIRVVFALGLMIPLGSSGFSSGQFMVMKFAEWGSNFGTNGWKAYVTTAMENASVTVPMPKQEPLLPLIRGYMRMSTCRVAYNGYGYQAQGTPFSVAETPYPENQQIIAIPDAGQGDPLKAVNGSYSYTNSLHQSLCGRVIYPTGNDKDLIHDAADGDHPIRQATAQFKQYMLRTWADIFTGESYAGSSGPVAYFPASSSGKGAYGAIPTMGVDRDIPVHDYSIRWACGFVSQHLWGDVDGGGKVLNLDCGASNGADPDGDKPCNSGGYGGGQYPDMTCITHGDNMSQYITERIRSAAEHAYNEFGNHTASPLWDRGWASMGVFYMNISKMNMTVAHMMKVPVKIVPPAPYTGGDNQAKKVKEVMAKFEDWWNKVPKGETIPTPLGPDGEPLKKEEDSGGCGFMGCVVDFVGNAASTVGNAASDAAGGVASAVGAIVDIGGDVASFLADPVGNFLGELTHKIKSSMAGDHILFIPDPEQTHGENGKPLYPLGILSNIGHMMVAISTDIYIMITVLEVAMGAIPTISAGAALAASPLSALMNICGFTMMSFGAVLLFYLPCLPMIRVAYAVMVWAGIVFEAVMLVPIAALAFLTTVGEGWGEQAAFMQWLEVLLRPILTVIGFVGAILLFNTFFSYFQYVFMDLIQVGLEKGTIMEFVGMFIHCGMFVTIMYTAANASFKLMTVLPNALYRWGPKGGYQSHYGDQIASMEGDFSGPANQMGGWGNQGMSAGAKGLGGAAGGARKLGGKLASSFKKGPPSVTPGGGGGA